MRGSAQIQAVTEQLPEDTELLAGEVRGLARMYDAGYAAGLAAGLAAAQGQQGRRPRRRADGHRQPPIMRLVE